MLSKYYCTACPLEGWYGDTEKNGPFLRMKQLKRQGTERRPIIRFVFLKVALNKIPRMG